MVFDEWKMSCECQHIFILTSTRSWFASDFSPPQILGLDENSVAGFPMVWNTTLLPCGMIWCYTYCSWLLSEVELFSFMLFEENVIWGGGCCWNTKLYLQFGMETCLWHFICGSTSQWSRPLTAYVRKPIWQYVSYLLFYPLAFHWQDSLPICVYIGAN